MSTFRIQGSEILMNQLKDLKTRKLKVRAGIFDNATNVATGESIALYAACNEFGTATAPSRPFMRHTIETQKDAWVAGLSSLLKKGMGADSAMKLLGKRMADDIVNTISQAGALFAPNTPATKKAKTKDVTGLVKKGETMVPGTLIDTGSMANAVDYMVTGGD